MTRKKFNVTGMTCSACSAHVEKAVSKVPGVQSVAVSLLTNTMQVQYDEGATIRTPSSPRSSRRATARRIQRAYRANRFKPPRPRRTIKRR